MTTPADKAYYQRRARQERDQAEQSSDLCSRAIHAELATEYERRAAAPSA